MSDKKGKNNLTKVKPDYKKIKANGHDEEVSTDFFDYYDDDEPYQEIAIT